MMGEQIGQRGRRGHLHLILIVVILDGTFRLGFLLLMPERLFVEHGWKLGLEGNLSERINARTVWKRASALTFFISSTFRSLFF